jgi:deoxyribodipyrimidine photo-lyase
LAAISESTEIVPVFILDPKLIKTGGSKRLAYLGQSLRALDESLNNSLHIIAGDQLTVLRDLQNKYDAESVHISAEYEPYGATRDKNIEAGGIKLIRTGSPYAVAPGRVLKPSDNTPYRVYTPFYKAWFAHGWRKPAERPKDIPTVKPDSEAR